jgi:hypothetical protein
MKKLLKPKGKNYSKKLGFKDNKAYNKSKKLLKKVL